MGGKGVNTILLEKLLDKIRRRVEREEGGGVLESREWKERR